MKIVVDKMPDHPENCPYKAHRENGVGDKWIGCTLCSIVCEDTKKCPVFASLPEVSK